MKAWKAAFPKENGVVGAARNRSTIIAFAQSMLQDSDAEARARVLGGLAKLVAASQRTGVDAPFLASLREVYSTPNTWLALKNVKSSDAVERRSCYALLERLPQDAADAKCSGAVRALLALDQEDLEVGALWSCVASIASPETVEHASTRLDVSTRAARAVTKAAKDRYHAKSVAQHVAKLCEALSDPSEVVDALMNSGSAPLVAAAVSIASEKWASAAAFLRLEAPPRSSIERVARSLAKTEPQQASDRLFTLALGVDATAKSCGAVLAAAPTSWADLTFAFIEEALPLTRVSRRCLFLGELASSPLSKRAEQALPPDEAASLLNDTTMDALCALASKRASKGDNETRDALVANAGAALDDVLALLPPSVLTGAAGKTVEEALPRNPSIAPFASVEALRACAADVPREALSSLVKECGRSCDLAADVMGRALVLGALDEFENALSCVRGDDKNEAARKALQTLASSGSADLDVWRAALSKCSSTAKGAAPVVNAVAWREGRNDTFLDLLEDSGEDISRIGGDDVLVEALLRLDSRKGPCDAELALELALDGLQDACTVSQGGGASTIVLPLAKVPSLLLATLKVALGNRSVAASLRVASALGERLPSSATKQEPLRQNEDVSYIPTNESCRILCVHTDDDETFYTVRFGDGREKQTVAAKLKRDSAEVEAPYSQLSDRIAELRDASKDAKPSAAWLCTKIVRRLGASDSVFREIAVDALCAGDASHVRALAATGTASERALASLTGDAASCRFVAQTLSSYSLTDATCRRAADVMARGLSLQSDAARAAALACAATVLQSAAARVVPFEVVSTTLQEACAFMNKEEGSPAYVSALDCAESCIAELHRRNEGKKIDLDAAALTPLLDADPRLAACVADVLGICGACGSPTTDQGVLLRAVVDLDVGEDDPLISRAFDACMAIVSASLPALKRRPVDKCIDGPCSAYLKKHQAEPASLLACWALHRLCVSRAAEARRWGASARPRDAERARSLVVDVLKETPVAKALQIVASEGFGEETNPDSTLKVKVASRARTVTAQYERDECLIEMVLSYDPAFPFRSVSVSFGLHQGIDEKKARRWALRLRAAAETTTAKRAVLDWRKDVDLEFDGVEPCPVCYGVLHPKSKKLPHLECATCHNKFHASCLAEWFQKSHKHTCVVCQTEFVAVKAPRRSSEARRPALSDSEDDVPPAPPPVAAPAPPPAPPAALYDEDELD